eukprot:4003461-Pleurochrysis_carterae.AAC.1
MVGGVNISVVCVHASGAIAHVYDCDCVATCLMPLVGVRPVYTAILYTMCGQLGAPVPFPNLTRAWGRLPPAY